MLIEFSVENFRSIRDEARLSLVASQSKKEHYENNVITPSLAGDVKGFSLLRSAALYGANASGKSNLITALAAMKRIVTGSNQKLTKLPVEPFKFSKKTNSAPSVFEVAILVNGVRYQYGFSATSEAIHEEWLFAFPKGRPQTWFKRSLIADGEYEYNLGDKLEGDKDVWKRATRPNALFLSTAVQLNSQQLTPIHDWFDDKLRILNRGVPGLTIAYCRDEIRKKKILEFLKAADFAISELNVREERFSFDKLPSDLPDEMHKFFEQHFEEGEEIFELKTFHRSDSGKLVELDLNEESDGTQKMFGLAGVWLESLKNSHVLFIDELHNSLHPFLVKFLIQLFHNNITNPDEAQLVFSTHETSVLSQNLFRRDQIWFCERDDKQNTRLYPLDEFKPRKGSNNLERAYLSGRYGALPYLRAITDNFGE